MAMTPDALERFTPKYKVVPETACWEWTASIWQGYGTFRYEGTVRRAHRLSYEHWVGEIPVGLELDHVCRNKACVNPAHLEAVSHRENMRRAPHIARQVAATECPHGHPYSDENTYVNKGKRYCRECIRIAQRKQHAKRKVL